MALANPDQFPAKGRPVVGGLAKELEKPQEILI